MTATRLAIAVSALMFASLKASAFSQKNVSEFTQYCEETIANKSGSEGAWTLLKIIEALKTKDCSAAADILSDIDAINLEASRIVELEPFRFLPHLTRLTLSKNAINDVSPLAGLVHLVHLDLSKNNISVITPLASLKKLESLNLSSNQVVDIAPLRNLINLQNVFLTDNYLNEIGDLLQLKNLFEINISHNNGIDELGDICKNLRLKRIDISETTISDLAPLRRCTALSIVRATDLNLKSAHSLADLASLTEVDLSHNLLTDLRFLSKLANLERVKARHNYISDLSPLRPLRNLKVVDLASNAIEGNLYISDSLSAIDLSDNPVKEVSSVCLNSQLKTLALEDTNLSTLTSLRGCVRLLDLNVKNNQIKDLSDLNLFPDLMKFNASKNYIFALPGFASLKSKHTIINLSLKENYLSDIDALKQLSNLEVLEVGSNRIQQMPDLAVFPLLKTLDLSNNPVTRLIGKHTALSNLNIGGTAIRGVLDLRSFKNLSNLDLHGMQLSGIIGLGELQSLQTLHLKRLKVEGGISSLNEQLSRLELLQALDVSATGMADLTWIESMRHAGLQDLDLSENPHLKSIKSLSSLKQLRTLNVSKTAVTHLNLSTEGNYLKRLLADHLALTNHEPLNADFLKVVSVRSGRLKDLRLLTGLSHLDFVSADQNRIQTLVGLASTKHLKFLSLSDNPISHLNTSEESTQSDLKALSNLRYLTLGQHGRQYEVDLTSLGEIKNLNTLHLFGTSSFALDDIAALSCLQDLSLDAAALRSLDMLSGLNFLRSFSAVAPPLPSDTATNDAQNRFTDLSPLRSKARLRTVHLDFNHQLEDLSPLANVSSLRTLSLQETTIEAFELGNGSFANLNDLFLSRTKRLAHVKKIGLPGLDQAKHLASLTLNNNATADTLKAVGNVITLRNLNIRENNISHLAPLAELRAMKHIDLQGNNISDASPLRNMEHVDYIDLRFTPIKTCPVPENFRTICKF